jgi:hypothetical protein
VFMQATKVTKKDGSIVEPKPWEKARQTADGWMIDRRDQKKFAFFGIDNDGSPVVDEKTGNRQAEFGSSPKPWNSAKMNDWPGSTHPDERFYFETVAVCVSGDEIGIVYGAIKWSIQAVGMKAFVAGQPTFSQTPSAEFLAAATKWNDQRKEAKELDRNHADQSKIPELRFRKR